MLTGSVVEVFVGGWCFCCLFVEAFYSHARLDLLLDVLPFGTRRAYLKVHAELT